MEENIGDFDEMDEALKIFVTESREHLATIENDLLTIEAAGANIDDALVNKVFRAAHSIKGGSGFFGFVKIKELAHKAETLLDMLRSRKIVPNAEVTNILLSAFDQLRGMVNDTSHSEDADIADLVASLINLASSYLPAPLKAGLVAEASLAIPGRADTVRLPQTDVDRARREGRFISLIDCDLVHDIEQKGLSIMDIFSQLLIECEVLDCAVDYAAVGSLDDLIINRVPLRLVIASPRDPRQMTGFISTIAPEKIHILLSPETAATATVPAEKPPLKTAAPPAPTPGQSGGAETGSGGEDTIRVNVEILENLMNLAGELVLSRNQLRAAVAQSNRELLSSADQRVNQVTSELQDVIMQTRLQPIGNVFMKFPRLVRDLSHTLGKDIQLDVEGKDVALDKTIIEGLSDPLTHMIRNAVDHGIELSELRIKAGKKAQGRVKISARHEAGQVVIELIDDGKGIDPQAIADTAVRKGLISIDKVKGMNDKDRQALIFLPGLSTAQVLSDVSGRGVGMDVVKTNLDRLGGQVEISSEPGKGSTFRIKLPLTLAIIPSLIVTVNNERFALPQANIEELLRLHSGDAKNRIEIVGDTEVLRLREKILPLTRFADIIGAVPVYADSQTGRSEVDRRERLADRRSPRHPLEAAGAPAEGVAGEAAYPRNGPERRTAAASTLEIAIVNTGTMSYGLVVGEFHDTEEVVVKPLGQRLKHLKEYSGATILGDGTVALILDVAGIAVKAGLSSVAGSMRAAELAAALEAERYKDIHAMLLFHNGPEEQCAISLDLVQRIERISPSQVEHIGQLRTMQYRGRSLPLVALSDTAKVHTLDDEQDLVVLVTNACGREVGLLCSMPVDVIETQIEVDQTTHRQKGIAGSAIFRERTTLIADLFELVDTAYPDWRQDRMEAQPLGKLPADGGSTVLLVEDSDFFRQQIRKYLEQEGFKVLTASDGEVGWDTLLKNIASVRVVVTDIEMPRLNGLGLTARIRADNRTANLPVIAVTSLAGDEDAERGLAAGVNEYQVKLDRDRLVASIRSRMGDSG